MKVKTPYRMTVAEQKAFQREINIQLANNVENLRKKFESIILWELHEQFGFGTQRLEKFHDAFLDRLRELQEYYALRDDSDQEFICKEKLKEIGYDLDNKSKMLKIDYTLNE